VVLNYDPEIPQERFRSAGVAAVLTNSSGRLPEPFPDDFIERKREVVMLQIAVINESTAISDGHVQEMLSAFDQQWNKDLAPIWGIEPAAFAFVPRGPAPVAGSWWVVFFENSDQAGALAYHDLTNEGLPISKVFVKTLLADNASVSVGATHEICEMAVDPWLNSAYQDQRGVFWAGEVCDPVESDQYGYQIKGILVTDFVTPNWYGHQHAHGAIDFKGHSRKAFEVLTGGYAQKFDSHRGWVQVTGSKAMMSQHGVHAAPGSRRERRTRHWEGWSRSEVVFNDHHR
jgi:hypothetical protein